MGYESAVFVMIAFGGLFLGTKRLLSKLARSLGKVRLEYEKARIQVKRRDPKSLNRVQTAYASKQVEHNQATFSKAKLDGAVTVAGIKVVQGMSEEELRQNANKSLKKI